MADSTYPRNADDDGGVNAGRASVTSAPLWVWVVGIVVLGTALAMIVSMSAGLLMGGMSGGGH